MASLVSGLVGSDTQVSGVFVVRGLSGGDDLPEVGRLELVGLGEGRDGGLQEVALGRGRTLGLGCWMLVVVLSSLSLAILGSPAESYDALPLRCPCPPQQYRTIRNTPAHCTAARPLLIRPIERPIG